MKVLNALDLKSGKKAEPGYNKMGTLTQPIQFISKKNKDEEWTAWNMDWFEWQGLKQLRRNARRMLKNYKLANGVIDKTDYIVEEDNEYVDIVESLIEEDVSALELKFYPIIPNVVNTLCNEFSKRNTKLTYRSVDETSYNEMLEEKRLQIEQSLVTQAQQKLIASLMEAGMDIEGEEAQQKLSMDNIKSLPQIEEFFRKDYRSIAEEWAQHQYEADMERMNLDELEERGFRDLLTVDREFWHFKMYDDDYDLELWNPVLTFYHKSPDTRYISDGNWVGKVDMMSVADVIDKYGWIMNEEQLEALEAIYPVRSAGYAIQGYQNDGSYYDATQSHASNVEGPSLAYRQFMSVHDNSSSTATDSDIVSWILGESEDFLDFGSTHLLRVTTTYWKSQRKLGHLTKISDSGETLQQIVTEDYKVTDKPIYNTNLLKNKGPENLVFGEHVEWIWINEVWGGVKIGPNHSSFWGMNNPEGVDPMYLGINQNTVGRVKFQFKGNQTLYGCKLPVEGRIFSDRNSKSISLVDQMKPWQIGYNIVNNQIADILVDELGTVIMFDQNALPRHSMGEDWGKNNLAKAYVAMKDFQMLPLDSTITNTENPIANTAFQTLNLEQTNRLMSRIQLAGYFKNEAFSNIGVNQQRMGQQIEQETAEGVRAALNGSYAQTEQYFINHSDQLMPRVHQMRTDLAQYYHSTKPSVTLQYLTSADEKINFAINGEELMLRDIHVYATTKSNHRAVLEKLRRLAESNNTSGASIYDLGNMIKADSIPEITDVMKASEAKVNKARAEDQQHQQKMQEEKIAAEQAEKQASRNYEASEAEKERRKDILVAEIRASGYGSMMDINQNLQSDFKDAMDDIKETEQYQDQTSLKRDAESNKMAINKDKLSLEREKINASKQISRDKLNIARENKNKYDFPKGKDDKGNKKS
jgi:hypothetical protein